MGRKGSIIALLVGFIAILGGTVGCFIWSIKLGAPFLCFILQIICACVNVAQIVLYMLYFAKSTKGGFSKKWKWILLGVNVLWFACSCGHFVAATLLMSFRYDLLLIVAMQAVMILLLYVWWERTEFRASKKMMTAEAGKEEAVEKKYKLSHYAGFMAVMLVIAAIIGVGVPYALTSSLNKNAGGYRTLQYEKSEDGEEYYVSGIYWGTSDKVLIPSEIYGKKVTKIKENALNTQSIKNQIFAGRGVINEIVFEDTEEAPCHIKALETNAIVSDKITTLSIPESVEEFQSNAIIAENLTEIVCAASKGNLYFGTTVDAPNVQSVTITTTSTVALNFGAGYQLSDVSIKIINDQENVSDTDAVQEKYNYFRKNYPQIKEHLEVNDIGSKVIVNFETGIDGMYIDSRILAPTEINTVVLTNEYFGGLKDATKEYVADKTYVKQDGSYLYPIIGGDKAVYGYALRGWKQAGSGYLVFERDNSTAFMPIGNVVTITAQWTPVCKVEYEWGDFYTPNNTEALPTYFAPKEETNNYDLPVYSDFNRTGYKELTWYCYDKNDAKYYSETSSYTRTSSFVKSVTLTPIWTLVTPTLTRELEKETQAEGKRIESTTSVSFVYDEFTKLTAKYTLGHVLGKDLSYAIDWQYTPDASASEQQATACSGSFTIRYDENSHTRCLIENVTNTSIKFGGVYDDREKTYVVSFEVSTVKQSGAYALTARGRSYNPEQVEQVSSTYVDQFTVEIEKKDMDLSNTLFFSDVDENNLRVFTYDGQPKGLNLVSTSEIPVRVIYEGNGNTEASETDYEVHATIVKVLQGGADDPNYNRYIYTKTGRYHIDKCTVHIRWRMDKKGDYGNRFALVYDGTSHAPKAEYAPNTPAEILSKGEIALNAEFDVTSKNVGTYVAQIKEPDDVQNYVFVEEEKLCYWTIACRPALFRWEDDSTFVYNKKAYRITASIDNLCPGDSCEPEYSGNVQINACGDEKYTAQVTHLGNDNYTLEGAENASCVWEIRPKALQVEWRADQAFSIKENAIHMPYNGATQRVYARVTNAEQGDEISFVYSGELVASNGNVNDFSNENYAKRVGSYRATIESIDDSQGTAYGRNYSITELSLDPTKRGKTCAWVIDAVQLSTEWSVTQSFTYDKTDKSVTLNITGFIGDEASLLSAENFTCVNAGTTVSYSYNEQSQGAYRITFTAKNAGTYGIGCSTVVADNYTLTATNIDMTIGKKLVRFRWFVDEEKTAEYNDDTPFMYDATAHMVYPEILASDIIDGDTVTFTQNGNVATSAGEHKAEILSLDNDNYYHIEQDTTLVWHVLPKTLALEDAQMGRYEYDGYQHESSVRITGFCGGDEDQFGFDQFDTVSDPQGAEKLFTKEDGSILIRLTAVNAKTYTLIRKGYNDTNYSMPKIQIDVVIDKRVAVIEWNQPSSAYTYDNEEHSVDAVVVNTVHNESTDTDDVVLLTYNNNVKVHAGTYVASVASLNNANYTFVKDGSERLSWTIRKKPVDVYWTTNTELVYNGGDQASSINANVSGGIIEGDSVEIEYDAIIAINCSDYSRTIKAIKNTQGLVEFEDYCVSDGTKAPCAFSIVQKEITLSWETKDMVYNGTQQGITAAIGGLCGDDGQYITLQYSDNVQTDAGNYTAKVTEINSSNGSQNYKLPLNKEKAWTIRKKPLTINYIHKNRVLTYDQQDQEVYLEISGYLEENLINHSWFKVDDGKCGIVRIEEVGATTRLYFTGKDAQGYDVSMDLTEQTNYTVEGKIAFSFTIAPKTLTLTWMCDGVRAADSYTYRSTEYELSVRWKTGEVYSGDDVGFTYENNVQTNVGTYTARVTGCMNANYSANSSKSWRIDPIALAVTWANLPENGYTYDKSPKTVSATVSGVLDSDVTGVFDAIAISGTDYVKECNDRVITIRSDNTRNAGTYTSTITMNGISNYVIKQNGTKTYTIAKKSIGVLWGETNSFTFDGTQKEVRCSTVPSDVCSGDVVVLSLQNESKRDVSDYVATVALATTGVNDNANYSLRTDGTSYFWSIIAKTVSDSDVSYSATSGSEEYNAQDKIVKITVRGLCDEVTKSGLTGSVGGKAIKDSEYCKVSYQDGTATITLTYKDANTYEARITALHKNYTLASAIQSTYTITPKPITNKNVDMTAFTYNGSSQSVSITPTGICEGDSAPFVFSGTTNAIDAGSYTATITGIDNANYSLDLANDAKNVVWSIARKQLTPELPVSDGTYDGTDKSYTVTFNGLLGSDRIGDVSVVKRYGGANDTENRIRSNNNGTSVTFTVRNAGTYVVGVEGRANGNGNNTNYYFTGITKQIYIDKCALSVEDISFSTDDRYTYDGTTKEVVVTCSKVSGTITTEGTTAVNAGTYQAKVTGVTDTNYKLPDVALTREWVIVPKELDNNNVQKLTDYTYDGSAKTLQIQTVGCPDTLGTGDFTFATTDPYQSQATNAGTYTAKITGVNNTNYTVKENVTFGWNIAKAKLTIEWTQNWQGNNSALTYDGNEKTIFATITGAANADVATVRANLDVKDVKNEDVPTNISGTSIRCSVGNKNVGEYRIGISAKEAFANYEFSGSQKSFSISPKGVRLTWNVSPGYTYNGSEQSISAVFAGICDADKNVISGFKPGFNGTGYAPSVQTQGITFKATNAGTYTADVSGFEAAYSGNYGLNATSLTQTFTIQQKELQISWSTTKTFTYNAGKQGVVATISGAISNGDAEGLEEIISADLKKNTVGADDVGKAVDGNSILFTFETKNAGTYTATIYAATFVVPYDNYKVSANQGVSFTINPKPVKPKDVTIQYSKKEEDDWSTYSTSNMPTYYGEKGYKLRAKIVDADNVQADIYVNDVKVTEPIVVFGSLTVTVKGVKNPNYILEAEKAETIIVASLALAASDFDLSVGADNTISYTLLGKDVEIDDIRDRIRISVKCVHVENKTYELTYMNTYGEPLNKPIHTDDKITWSGPAVWYCEIVEINNKNQIINLRTQQQQ